jgi:hypothetical protein
MASRRAWDVDVGEAMAAAIRTRALRATLKADGARPATEPFAEGGALVGTAAGEVARPAGMRRIEVVTDRTRGVAGVARAASTTRAARHSAERDIRSHQPQPSAEGTGAQEPEELSARGASREHERSRAGDVHDRIVHRFAAANKPRLGRSPEASTVGSKRSSYGVCEATEAAVVGSTPQDLSLRRIRSSASSIQGPTRRMNKRSLAPNATAGRDPSS